MSRYDITISIENINYQWNNNWWVSNTTNILISIYYSYHVKSKRNDAGLWDYNESLSDEGKKKAVCERFENELKELVRLPECVE